MEYKEYLKAQDKGKRLMQAIRSALKALDSKDVLKCQAWLIHHKKEV